MDHHGEWEKIESIVDQALDLDSEQRIAFIKKKCGNNNRIFQKALELIEAIESSDGYLEETVHDHLSLINEWTEISAQKESSFIGQTIDQYKITRLVEHGGMGSVFEAHRVGEAFEQKVALKIIRRGMDTPANIARFNREQQILANLHHPNIAQLYDGGITDDGLPYLIMEYVEGTPIDEYCNNQKLTVDERIELFKQVCKAIQHAHKNLIIHRDLKPSNILVTEEGHVMILDFGISKILENDTDALFQTREQIRPVSLGYAAPEQLQNKSITTSVDTYGLGILLYQLLIGLHPFDLAEHSVSEMEQIILNEPAPSPLKRYRNINSESEKEAIAEKRSTTPEKLISGIKGDLEAIIIKLLLKDSNHRYGSTEELLSDLERYQNELPVKAQHNTIGYRIHKFVKRNRKGLATAAVFLITLLGIATYFTNQIAKERDQAEQEAAKAEQIAQFTLDIFESNNPYQSRGDTITVKQVLKQAKEKIDNLNEEPMVKSRYMLHIGKVYYEIGRPFEAKELLQEAGDIQKKYSDEPTIEQADILLHRGLLEFHFLENNDQAEAFFNESMDIAEQLSKTDHITYYRNMEHLGAIQRQRGNFDSAKVLYERAEGGYEQLREEKDHHTYQVSSSRSLLEKYSGNLTKAETLQRQFLEKQVNEYGENHPATVEAMDYLASTLRKADKNKEALQLFERALKNAKQIWGNHSLEVASIRNSLGVTQREIGQYDSAETHYKKVLKIRKDKLGPDHPDVATVYNNLAILHSFKKNYDVTLTYLHKSLSIRKKWYGSDHLRTAHAFSNIGYLHKDTERLDSAMTYFKKAHKIRKKLLPADHLKYAESLYDMSVIYGKCKEWEKAERYLRKALDMQQQKLNSNHPDLMKTYFAMGLLMKRSKQYKKAIPYYRKVLKFRKNNPGDDFTRYSNTAKRLAEVYQEIGQPNKADSLLSKLK